MKYLKELKFEALFFALYYVLVYFAMQYHAVTGAIDALNVVVLFALFVISHRAAHFIGPKIGINE